jgi:hypothetical protein
MGEGVTSSRTASHVITFACCVMAPSKFPLAMFAAVAYPRMGGFRRWLVPTYSASAGAVSIIEGLQLAGWLLTLVGQVLVTLKFRSAFVVWGVANVCLFAVQVRAELYWAAGMFATNLAFCFWSFRRW